MGWSADGNWFWDGAQWNEAVSEDGKWRFDGNGWQPFGGQRSGMPAPPAPPAPAPAPVAAAQADVPSWVDPSEIERIAREKQEREAIAAQPVAPLPPEQDWRHAGEFIQYSHNVTYRSWQYGWRSFLYYMLLLWFCGPFAVIFVWFTAWNLPRKLIATFVCFLSLLAVLSYLAQRRATG